MLIECPTPAYKKVLETDLKKIILSKRERVHSILLGNYAYTGEGIGQEIFERVKDYFVKKNTTAAKTELYSDLQRLFLKLESEEDLYLPAHSEEVLMEFPSLLGFVVLDEGVLNFTKYGFNTIRQLEETITSFCIGEKGLICDWREDYYWRNNDYKNLLSHGEHGDLCALQTDVSGKKGIEKTLFGEEEYFDTWKEVEGLSRGFNAHYDNWESFLMIILKYTEVLGKSKIPEIINWKDVLKEIGFVGTNTAEAEFGEYVDKFHLDFLREGSILVEGADKIKVLPLSIYSDSGISYYPYVSDSKLWFIKKDNQGILKPSAFKGTSFEEFLFSVCLKYNGGDLVDLLKGTYRLFARDRSILPRIMDIFINP